MKVNPMAIVFWLVCAAVGFLIAGTVRATVWGFVIGFAISILIGVLDSMFKSSPRRRW